LEFISQQLADVVCL